MGDIAKQVAIYLSLLLVCACFTMIAPFYPDIASSKGVPLWLIGAVFSTDPVSALLTSMFLGKFMQFIGRKQIIILSLCLISLSMFILSPIESCDMQALLLLSFASRIVAGMGYGGLMTAADTIFTSDYPDQLETMIGRMEGAIGVGLILGPVIGTALYIESLFIALVSFGGLILLFTPVAWYMLGTFRDYLVHTENFSAWGLMLKTVRDI